MLTFPHDAGQWAHPLYIDQFDLVMTLLEFIVNIGHKTTCRSISRYKLLSRARISEIQLGLDSLFLVIAIYY